MKITFLGTRGEIKPKSKAHGMHTSTLFSQAGKHVLVDFGESWLGKFSTLRPKPDHIVLTHAHPDHAFGLKEEVSCPVWATKQTWKLIDAFPIPQKNRRVIEPKKKKRIGGIQFEAFALLHSLRCPAVGFRITTGKLKLFYAPDVAWIKKMETALKNIQIYIGDGACITRIMIRKTKDKEEIFGHANIRQQLTWCQKNGVPEMIITHCGSDIVSHPKIAQKKIAFLAEERDVAALIAYDGMTLLI